MPTIKDTITTLATDAGYDGDRPQTIADAIEAYGTVAGGGGGAGGVTVVNSTGQTGQSTYTLDTSLADCIAMLEAGTQFVVHISTSTYNFYFHPAAYMKNNPSSIDFIGYMNNYIQRATYDSTGFTYGTGGCVVYVTQSDVH